MLREFEVKASEGLTSCKLRSLAKVVVLIGENGAGKSRILNQVEATIAGKSHQSSASADPRLNEFRHMEVIRIEGRDPKTDLQQPLNEDLPEFPEALSTDVIEDLESYLSRYVNRLAIDYRDAVADRAKVDNEEENDFLDDMVGDDSMTPADAAWMSMVEEQTMQWKKEADKRIRRFEATKQLLEAFTGLELRAQGFGRVELGGVGLDVALKRLSRGERRLLVLSIAIAVERERARSATRRVLLFDEPETHFHPKRAVDLVGFFEKLPDTQIWIATHSVTLAACLPGATLVFVENGVASLAGNNPAKLVNGLLGGPDATIRLELFLRMPRVLSTVDFLCQCLVPPSVVGHRDDDPQMKDLISYLRDRKSKERLRLLDWGAGRGRFATAIAESDAHDGVDYFAFVGQGEDPENLASCERSVARLLDVSEIAASPDSRIFRSNAEFDRLRGKRFEIVLLCNVVHEIEPLQWPKLFKDLSRILEPSGVVCVVEDLLMPIGERAHRNGFVVLDQRSIARLFQLDEKHVGVREQREERDGRTRLVLYEIPASSVANAKLETVMDALREIRDRSRTYLEDALERLGTASPREGRVFAFHMHQFACSSLLCDLSNGTGDGA